MSDTWRETEAWKAMNLFGPADDPHPSFRDYDPADAFDGVDPEDAFDAFNPENDY